MDWFTGFLFVLSAVLLPSESFLRQQTGSVGAGARTAHVQEQTGVVAGKVELRATSQVVRIERGARYRSGSAAKTPQSPTEAMNERRSVVVYLEGENLKSLPPARDAKATIDQSNTMFVPHVLAIQKGTMVDFVNHDKIYHNVFSLSAPKKFNIGRRPTGQAVPIQFDKPGVIQVFCDIHSQMTAFVLVLDSPFFVRPEDDGTFKIDHVPPGSYTLKVWHERLSAPDQKITITAGATMKTNLVLE
jgi:plastocyanin